jgi:protein TonB
MYERNGNNILELDKQPANDSVVNLQKKPAMETKKNPKHDLSNYSGLFFNIGLFLAMGMVLIAFEWKSYDNVSAVDLGTTLTDFDEVIEDVPLTEQPPPPPQQIQQPQIVEVPDEEILEDDIEVDLDVEMTEETVIEAAVFEEMPEEEEVEEIYTIVEEMPSFPGGTTEFYKYVAKNLIYPSKARKAAVEGRVIVRFVVDKDGNIGQVEVLRGIGFGCDEEAIRVIKDSPRWAPGKQRGRAVKVSVTVPLNFKLS